MVGWHHQQMDMNLSKLQKMVKDREAWYAVVQGLQRVRHNLVTEQQQQELTVQLWERISLERRDEFKTFSELDVSDVEEWKW